MDYISQVVIVSCVSLSFPNPPLVSTTQQNLTKSSQYLLGTFQLYEYCEFRQ